MQSNANVKGRAIFSGEEEIREKSLQLYTYLVCRANLRNAPNKFGDNVRILQQKDLVLAQIGRTLHIKDGRTIKKYMEELEDAGLVRFCPRGWEEIKVDDKGNKIQLDKRWTQRLKHKETYYEIPVRRGMLFRKIPKETLVKLNEIYQVGEFVLKIYMTLINYQEECICNDFLYKRFTIVDLGDILDFDGTDTRWKQKVKYALNILNSLGLIDIEKGNYTNSFGTICNVFVLNQVNFYINFNIMEFETADESVIPEEIKKKIIEDSKKNQKII